MAERRVQCLLGALSNAGGKLASIFQIDFAVSLMRVWKNLSNFHIGLRKFFNVYIFKSQNARFFNEAGLTIHIPDPSVS